VSGINGVSNIDTITGATKIFYNAGIHTEINLKGHFIETGLDYISFDQSVEYELPSLSVAGNRALSFHQLRLPLTYNLQLFKNRQNHPRLILIYIEAVEYMKIFIMKPKVSAAIVF